MNQTLKHNQYQMSTILVATSFKTRLNPSLGIPIPEAGMHISTNSNRKDSSSIHADIISINSNRGSYCSIHIGIVTTNSNRSNSNSIHIDMTSINSNRRVTILSTSIQYGLTVIETKPSIYPHRYPIIR